MLKKERTNKKKSSAWLPVFFNQFVISLSKRKNCQYNIKHVQKILLFRNNDVLIRQFITQTLISYFKQY